VSFFHRHAGLSFWICVVILLSFLCHFIVLWEMQNKCIEKNSQSANCKTPSTKRNREKCRPLKFAAPHFDGFLKSSRKCYIYFFSLSVPMALGIFPYLSGTHFEKRPDRLEALVQVAPRPWVRPLFTIPADHRTRAPNRDAASKCAAVLAMPCHASNMGSPGSRQEWSLTPRPAISVLGITIETSIDYNGCRNDVPAGKKNMEK
jgi:hypothetical protein